jgi:CubicO group peptidase (beta-lactamase class C family)
MSSIHNHNFSIYFSLPAFKKRVLIIYRAWALFVVVPCMFLAACSDGSSDNIDFVYTAAVEEGRTAAKEILDKTGADSMIVGFCTGDRIVWTEGFGYADMETETVPNVDTTLYGIGSVSKMFVTVAAMLLVDEGRIHLDEPVTTYIPDFFMLSSEYSDVTVRMLLNHSSGFPGTQYRNSETTAPNLDYADEVMESLQHERLKHSPGYLQTYCNDGFTLIEKLIYNVTGKSYVEFLQDEVLDPLGMNNSRLALSCFPEDSFARSYTDGVKDSQVFVNAYGSGGMNTTATDMLKFAMMLIGKGKLEDTRILSEVSVAAMGTDQTMGKFSPVICQSLRYGLGWDTVTQPAFLPYGITAWQKGGDVSKYGSALFVLPEENMAVFVAGTTGVSSADALVVAERVLLMALYERGEIPVFPGPLKSESKPVKDPVSGQLDDICGFFASPSGILKIERDADNSINMSTYSGENTWTPPGNNLKMRSNDLFSSDASPLQEFYTATGDGRTYLVMRSVMGNGHYHDEIIIAEKITSGGSLSSAWTERLSPKQWLLVNEFPDSILLTNNVTLEIEEIKGLEGFVSVSAGGGYSLLDPALAQGSEVDRLASMKMFLLPQAGSDVGDLLAFEHENGEGWFRFKSYIYRPKETVEMLGSSVTIDEDGYNQWRRLSSPGQKTVYITGGSAWKIWDAGFNLIDFGAGPGTAVLPDTSGGCYLQFFGKPGDVVFTEIL